MLIKKIDKTHMEVKMYGNIGSWFVSGESFTSMLDEFKAQGVTEVTFKMHCYGGNVFEGNVIGNAFGQSGMKINIIIDGISASMGCMILPYVPVENIKIADNGFGMLHRPTGGSIGGDAGDHLSSAKLLLDIEGNFIRTLAERTGKPAEEIKSFFDGKDHWLNADEMVAYKLAGSKFKSTTSIAALDKLRVENMTEEGVYGHFAASLDPGSNLLNINNKSDLHMKKELIDAFGLKGLTAESSDTAVLAALQAKFKENEDRLTTLENEAKAKQAASIKALLDGAAKEGKFKAEERATYELIGEKSGVAALTTVLAGMGAKTPIVMRLKPEGKGAGADGEKTFAWYQEHDVKALEAMPVSDPETFRELYKAEYGCYPA